MKILLNILGILIYFLNRFNGRADKIKEPSITFWIKDNWVELVIISVFDLALMLLGILGGLKIDFIKLLPSLPAWISISGDMALCFIIGLFGAYAGYSLIKKKVEDSKS